MKAIVSICTILLATAAVQTSAHANEMRQTTFPAQAYQSAYAVKTEAVPQRRIVRVAKTDTPRAVLVNGTYKMPTVHQTRTVRRVVRKDMPNLYKTNETAKMPVLFDKTAETAR